MRSIIIAAFLVSSIAVASAAIVTGNFYGGPSCPSPSSSFTINDGQVDMTTCNYFSTSSSVVNITTGYANVACIQNSTFTGFAMMAYSTLSACNNNLNPVFFMEGSTNFDSSQSPQCFDGMVPPGIGSFSNVNCNAPAVDISGFIAFIEKFLILVVVIFIVAVCCSVGTGIYFCCMPAFMACMYCANRNKDVNAYASMKDPLSQYNRPAYGQA